MALRAPSKSDTCKGAITRKRTTNIAVARSLCPAEWNKRAMKTQCSAQIDTAYIKRGNSQGDIGRSGHIPAEAAVMVKRVAE